MANEYQNSFEVKLISMTKEALTFVTISIGTFERFTVANSIYNSNRSLTINANYIIASDGFRIIEGQPHYKFKLISGTIVLIESLTFLNVSSDV